MALVATQDRYSASQLLLALWLPIHLTVAIVRVVERSIRDIPATVRTDPPPTAALVPLAMVAAALAGGHVAQALIERRSTARAETISTT